MISIIIINYRQKNFLLDCIRSIQDKFKYPYELIVINNSPENELKELDRVAKVVENSNKGYSQANNLGVKHANGEYLLFLNADTLIRNDFIGEAINILKKKDAGAVGLKMYNEDGSFQLSFWKENTIANEKVNKKWEEHFKKRDKGFTDKIENDYSDIVEVDWVSGAAMMMRKNVFEEIEGFDEKFFLFYEDADMCKRLTDKGYKIYFYPGSDIIHYKGENVNREFTGKTYFYSKQSQVYYYKKHNPISDRILLRIYLIAKFSYKYFTSFKSINLNILLMLLGLRNRP
mgnify:CR=1 FL=1